MTKSGSSSPIWTRSCATTLSLNAAAAARQARGVIVARQHFSPHLLQRLEQEERALTDDERRRLVRYVGWGGLPQVFDAWNEARTVERERLEQLPTPDELEHARATTLNAHYTAPAIIRAMYALLQRLGFTHGRILEPACGLGHFIGLMPEEMHTRSRITGIADCCWRRTTRANGANCSPDSVTFRSPGRR